MFDAVVSFASLCSAAAHQGLKMVDVVSPHAMPSESEVHVARSFLTKILRSSMRYRRRRNDPGSRPHTWHSSKLTEESSAPPPAPVWQPKHEARSKESSSQTDQKNQLSSRFSSLSSMERLDRPSHLHPPGRLSPTTEPPCGSGGKRDSGFGFFSNGSTPPVHDLGSSSRKGTSTENIFYKGLQSEGPQQAGRRYLQPEQPASRVSVAGRAGAGPVWQVPEKKRSQSPPPPPPPLRSDSFAATKVFPFSEVPSEQNGLRPHQEKTSESRRSFNPLPTKDFLHPSAAAAAAAAAADHNHNQLHPNKLFSLSSTDVRQSQAPAHQRQYSDESPLYLQTRSAPPSKTQSVGSYYCSLQDLPANVCSRKQARHSTAAGTGSVVNQNSEGGGHSRYYAMASKNPLQGIAEGWRGELEKPPWGSSSEAGFMKGKYPLPQPQTPYSENKELIGHPHVGNGLHHELQMCEHPADAAKRNEGHAHDTRRHVTDQKIELSRQQDPWVPQEDHRISPSKTPLLHSLAQESRSLAAVAAATSQDVGKANRRSDRYATTLRKEIQQKRAQLQKSRSAATLSCDAEDEEGEDWRSAEASTSSSVSYKDHLKEAQARVLQATSFQRRDLEPAVVKTSNARIRGRKRFPLAKRTHSFSEPDKIDKVGVEVDPQSGSFGERRKFFEAKPVFSRPVLRSSPGANLNTDLSETGKVKQRAQTSSVDPNHLGPEQRLGTFAEYQATWNKQKKEVKTQGRYHSAENILDTDVEEKKVCVHERSRSSPSADFYTQNIPSSWRDPQVQQSSYTTRGKSENRLRYQPDHSPQSTSAVPRNEGLLPGLSDHRTSPSHTTLPSGPSPGSQHPAPAPQTKSLLPPPRPHLGPETTSSSQEFLAGAQADQSALQPLSRRSSDAQHHAAAQGSSAGAGSPRLRRTPGPDMSEGDVETEQEKKQLLPPRPPSSPSPSPSPSSSWTDALSLPAADGARSPSPQFAPLRLTDEPPAASVQEESRLRLEEEESQPADVTGVRSPVRKVPVRIVHTESSSDREGRAYLPQNTDTCPVFSQHHHHVVPCLGATERPAQSLFSAYTRQTAVEPTSAPEEDAKREELVRDIMGKDKSLVDVLDQSGRKTTMDLMEGLFPSEEQILEGAHQRRRASASSRLPTSPPRSVDRREEEEVCVSAAASLVPSSSYYNTSAPKAELLIKMKDMQEQLEEQDSEDELDVDLASKKQELISSLARKLEVLREARQSLQEDVEDNETLGREVEATVQRRCQPNQLDKFRMFVGDLDKVVSLLLSLSGRLARVENALNSLEDEAPPEEKRTLTEKRKLLMRQHEDAKELKENLDRRERLVSGIMEVHLDAESLDDYRHFVKMKSALIIEQRKLEDKIKLGEEQLKCLLDSLPLEQRPPF
ncbi:hypothetical protein INR49_022065 [Caranx melampygus]|nr:hypothetical protein INR49_022065 [Caranx melampygus]